MRVKIDDHIFECNSIQHPEKSSLLIIIINNIKIIADCKNNFLAKKLFEEFFKKGYVDLTYYNLQEGEQENET